MKQILDEAAQNGGSFILSDDIILEKPVRLKGKGVPSLRNRNVRGDHFVTLVVQVPERMTEAQKEALRKFDDAMNGIAPEGEKHKKKGLFGKLEK